MRPARLRATTTDENFLLIMEKAQHLLSPLSLNLPKSAQRPFELKLSRLGALQISVTIVYH